MYANDVLCRGSSGEFHHASLTLESAKIVLVFPMKTVARITLDALLTHRDSSNLLWL